MLALKRSLEDEPSSEETLVRPRSVPPPTRGRCVDHLARSLVRAGVDTVYGIPGGAIGPLYDALIERPEIRVVHVRHETSAVFMAIGHARMRPDSLPCVLVTSGPGVTNAITGLAAAKAEGVPVLVLAGEVPRTRFGRNALQEGSADGIDVVHLVRSVTRSSASISSPGRAPFQLESAAQLARQQRGPVFLTLPLDVALANGAPSTITSPSAPERRVPGPDAIAATLAALRGASRPLFLAGSGARRGAAVLRSLAEDLGIPVITSPKAKGLVPEGSRVCLGVFGYGGHPSAQAFLDEAPPDVVVALGCGFGEPSTNSWSPLLQASRTMIQVDADGAVFGRNYRIDLAVHADCAAFLEALSRAAGDLPAYELALPRLSHYEPEARIEDRAPLHPARVVTALQASLPDTTVFTADIGEHLLFVLHHLRAGRPDQFIASLALGSMGSGIGAAVGAKLAAPHRRVVSISGDYGFQMYGMELATCVQERLDVIFVVMNDARMRMVEAGVHRSYGRGMAMDGPLCDFAALARAHGARGFVCRTVSELEAALADASTTGPTVLDVRIDRTATFPVNARVQEISNFTAR